MPSTNASFPHPSGIGIWRLAFELIGVLAVLTNVSLIAMSADFDKAAFKASSFVGVFGDRRQIFALLVLAGLFLKLVIAKAIPDTPADVRDAKKRPNDESYEGKKGK